MDQIRTMRDDLKKASQSPRDVAAAFSNNVFGGGGTQNSPTKPQNTVLNSSAPIPPKPQPSQSTKPISPPKTTTTILQTSAPPSNLPLTDSGIQENKSTDSVPKPILSTNAKPDLNMEKENIFKLSESSSPKSLVMSSPLSVQAVLQPKQIGFLSSLVFRYIIIGIIILLVMGGGLYSYFVFFNSPSGNLSVNTNTNSENNTIVPESLVPVDSTIDISVSAEQDMATAAKQSLLSLELENGNYARIFTYQEGTLLSFDSFLSALKLTISDNVKSMLTNDYTFFVYKQEGGLRYGLAVGTNGDVTAAVKKWEERIFQDLESLYIDSNPQTVGNKFSENNSYSTKLYYLNLPDSQTTLDYAIMNNLLIITTSKDSMIDLIKKL